MRKFTRKTTALIISGLVLGILGTALMITGIVLSFLNIDSIYWQFAWFAPFVSGYIILSYCAKLRMPEEIRQQELLFTEKEAKEHGKM